MHTHIKIGCSLVWGLIPNMILSILVYTLFNLTLLKCEDNYSDVNNMIIQFENRLHQN